MVVKNKTVVITGAGSGIGLATAKEFAGAGAKVVVADIDETGGERAVAEIVDGGGTARFAHTDVSSEKDVQSMFETAVEEFGGVDVLCNNAGIQGPLESIEAYEVERFDEIIAVNLRGVFLGMKYGIQAMQGDGGGSIINTSSIGAEVGVAGRGAYAAAKAGVNGLTRTAAIECARDGIRVNSVLPGIVETPMHERAAAQRGGGSPDIHSAEPMDGVTQPEEVARAIRFLSSDHASRITGVQLPIDGGFLISP